MIGSIVNGAAFVACLYALAGKNAFDRDNPSVIKNRFFRVGVASVIAPCVAVLCTLLPGSACSDVVSLRWFGLSSERFVRASLAPLALTMWLFLGPLAMCFLERDRYTPVLTQLRAYVATEKQRLQLLRNLLVGPLAEEWVFRSCMCVCTSVCT